MADRPLVAIECRLCTALFVMCLSCYRGHAYCSDECRGQAREKQTQRARAEHLRRLGPEDVRKANQERKSRQRECCSRQSEKQGAVTDQAPKVRGEPVGSGQLDRDSQGANTAAEPGAGRAPDQAQEQASATIPDPGLSRLAEIPREPDSLVQAPGQLPAAAPVVSDMAAATDEQAGGDTTASTDEQIGATTATDELGGDTMVATAEQADVDLRWQPHPEAVLGRCSRCGKPGWLVPWVLRATAKQRSLRCLLAKGGPQGRKSRQ